MKSTIEDTLRHVQFLNRYLNTFDIQCMTTVVLLELGISTKRDGFDYMKNGIVLLCEDPALLITKGVYPEIGKCYDPPVSNMQVEQSIRSAITDAWSQRNKRVWGYYFPEDTGRYSQKPTNAELMTRIARILELWQGCQKEVSYETK